jgi:hypothetical protein
VRDLKEFLEDEINRKLGELRESETRRKIEMAISDVKLKMLTDDLDILQKRLANFNKIVIKEKKNGHI